jgi:hypothetical protein
MKRVVCLITTIICLCLNSKAQQISIRDFSPPVSQAERLTGSIDLSSIGTDTMKSNGSSNIIYEKFYSSLLFSYYLMTDFNFRYSSKNDNISLNNVFHTNNNIQVSVSRYFSDSSKFSLNTGLGCQIYYDNKSYLYKSLQANPSIGVGYGRIIYANEMAKALRIAEYLSDEKLLKEPLDKETIIKIAEHISKIYEYSVKYGDKHPIDFYMDMEKILVNSGKLIQDKFTPYILLRIEEVINRERIFQRSFGWVITSGLSYSINKVYSDRTYNYDRIIPGISFNLGYPVTNTIQFNHSTNYSFSKSLYNSIDLVHNVSSTNSLSYEISNKIDVLGRYSFLATSYNSNKSTEIQQKLSLEFYYYLENQVYLSLQSYINHVKSYPDPYLYTNKLQPDKGITLNIGYRFF